MKSNCCICNKEVKLDRWQKGNLKRGNDILCDDNKCKLIKKQRYQAEYFERNGPKTTGESKTVTRRENKRLQRAKQQAAVDCQKYRICLNNETFNCHKCDEPRTKGAWMMSAEIPRRMADETHEINFRENLR